MNNTAKTYRERHTKEIIIDDLTWKIRAVSPDLLVGNLNLLPSKDKIEKMQKEVKKVEENEGLSPDMQDSLEQTMKALDVFLPAGVVEPKVVAKLGDAEGKDDTLWIKEITLPDRLDLFTKIMDLSGFGEEAEDARKKLENPPSPSASET
tara:strand:- start:206 stop:655 length:450 start_codon:yes stop_codon:yes gene_type:complete